MQFVREGKWFLRKKKDLVMMMRETSEVKMSEKTIYCLEKLSLASSSICSSFSFRREKSTDIDVVSTRSIIPVLPLSF